MTYCLTKLIKLDREKKKQKRKARTLKESLYWVGKSLMYQKCVISLFLIKLKPRM